MAALGFVKQKMISRRGFLEALLATGVLAPRVFGSAAIDRFALVTRHNPRLTKIDPLSPLSLGNGEFAFTADVTGLQTFPGDGVDQETMRRTLHEAVSRWQWDKTWGWDYPMTAMTAARLGETSIAIDALMMKTEKNRYLANGHNWQRPNLPCYLPGNGGLLYAIALMAGGWKGGPTKNAPGFPSDGRWTVRTENFRLAD